MRKESASLTSRLTQIAEVAQLHAYPRENHNNTYGMYAPSQRATTLVETFATVVPMVPSSAEAPPHPSEQGSVPPSPPATPVAFTAATHLDGLALGNLTSKPLRVVDYIHPITLVFREPELQCQYLSEITRTYAGSQCMVINGSIVVIYAALIAQYLQGEDDVGPCRRISQMVIPCAMAALGMLTHAPVGRTKNAYLEHQVLVWGGAFVMLAGVAAFIFTELANSDDTCTTWRVSFVNTSGFEEPGFLLFYASCMTVQVHLHILSFPFAFRLFVTASYLLLCLVMPNLTQEPKYVEVAFFWPGILLAGAFGHLVESKMRTKFLIRVRGLSLPDSTDRALWPLFITSGISFLLASVAYVARAAPSNGKTQHLPYLAWPCIALPLSVLVKLVQKRQC